MIGLSSHVYIPEDVKQVFITMPEYRSDGAIWMIISYLNSGARVKTVIRDQRELAGLVEDLKATCVEEKKYLQGRTLGYVYTPTNNE